MRSVLRHLARRQRIFIIACCMILAGFQFLLCAIVASTNVSGALEQVLSLAPPIFQGMISQFMLEGNTTAGLLAFGWNHPVTHALAMVLPITLAARAIAGEVENGAIELVLAQPISRRRYLSAHVLFALGATTIVPAAGAMATALGQSVFALGVFPFSRLVTLIVQLTLLQLAVFGLTLVFSAFGREAGRVAFAGVLVALLSFLADTVASLWPRVAAIERFTMHYYYDPRALLVEADNPLKPIAVLSAIAVISITAALFRFTKRDLP